MRYIQLFSKNDEKTNHQMKPRIEHSGKFSELSPGSFILDVRPIFENGGEPFSSIMDCVDQLQNDDTLDIVAPFEPHPLIKQLQAKHFIVKSEKKSADEYWVNVKKSLNS